MAQNNVKISFVQVPFIDKLCLHFELKYLHKLARGEVMAEWATLKANQGLRNAKVSLENALLPLMLGGLLARGSILDMYPFGVAFGAALILRGGKGVLFGLASVLLGLLTLTEPAWAYQIPVLIALAASLPLFRRNRRSMVYLGVISGVLTIMGHLAVQAWLGVGKIPLLSVGLEGFLTGALAVVFAYALAHQDVLWRGDFPREQGIAWLVLLTGVLSGLKGVYVADINFSVVVLTFFVLFAANRFGAGAAAGIGVALGFLPQLSMSMQNLVSAGIYGLAGFCTGAFQKLGKLGMGLAYMSAMLIITFSLQPEAIYSQIISTALGLVIFLLWPGIAARPEFLNPKQIPEVETAVTKVKTLAEMFEQIALTHQEGDRNTPAEHPDVPELMNILAERVCKNCPTIEVCWEREFYKTYHFLLDLFSLAESREVEVHELPIEWKRHCGRIKEMLLGVQFIVEQEKNQEVWRRRLEENNEALSYQYQSVSQVIGHLAKELHSRHNWEEMQAASISRRHRNLLDVGVVSLSKERGAVCGDNYASLAFAPNQHAFVISDGMGVGEGAGKMSATALTLLEQLLSTGFEPARAVQALNSMLVLRSPEEGFVTLDMAVLDMESGQGYLIKLGASPSYLKTDREVKLFNSSSLPIGILNQIEIPILDFEMAVGDYLVLVTDGVQDVLKTGDEWLKRFLATNKYKKAQDMANDIGKQMRAISGEALPDDGIILVVRRNCWPGEGKEQKHG